MNIDWKELVGSVAPVLGTALGGPMGGLAARALSKSLLGTEDATEDQLSEAVLSANTDQLLDLKKVDADFDKSMKALNVDLSKARLLDTQNARGMAKANMRPQIVLSTVFIAGYFVILYWMLTKTIQLDIPADWKMLIAGLIGLITSEVPRIMTFWFGSSSGSKEKTHKMKHDQSKD